MLRLSGQMYDAEGRFLMEAMNERKDQLIENLAMVISGDVLNEMDVLMILQICTDACERKKTELFEDMLTECILYGIDDEQEQSGTDDGASADSSL